MSGKNPNLPPMISPKPPSTLSEGKREEEEVARSLDTRPTSVSSNSDSLGLHCVPAVVHVSRPPTSTDPPKSAFTAPLRPLATPRTLVPQPVHPVTSHGGPPSISSTQAYASKPSPMASLIRGSQHLQPCPSSTTHLTCAPLAPAYSSHVPRGPAAVASITRPRAAVATPMVRPPHLQLASSMSQGSTPSTGSLHSQMQPRPLLPTVRNLMPSVAKTISSSIPPSCMPDSPRLSTLSNVATIQMATAAAHVDSLHRSATHSKPVHVSQPIMHTLQQLITHSHSASSTQMTGLNLASQTKVISQTVHTVAPLSSQPSVTNITSSISGISSNAATVVPTGHARQANTASIPVAKVHPQPVPVVSSRPPVDPLESSAVNLLLPPARRASPNHPTSTSVTDTPTSVVLMEPQQERPSNNKNGSFTVSLQQKMVPPTTYTYYEPYKNNLGLSSYGNSSSSFPPTSALQPGMGPSHPTPSLTATMQTVSRSSGSTTLNPLMVKIDPNRPLALHGNYTSVENTVSSSEPSSCSSISSTVYTVSSSGNTGTSFIVTQPPTSNASTPTPSSSSPRPSILRKRTIEGEALSREGGVPAHAENGDGLMSAAVPAAVTLSSMQLVSVKAEPGNEAAEGGASNALVSQPATGVGSAVETSPRKKPRKQQLTSNELMETHSTDAEEEFEKDKEIIKKEIVREDEEGVRWVAARQRPPITLLNSYRHTWKSRHNHFLRYSDVRPKERRPTVHDLVNQKGVLQKVSGWKVHHLCTQLDEVVEMEDSVYGRLAEFLSNMEQKTTKSDEDKDMNKVNELIKGNLQRCRLIRDQMREAQQQVLKVVEHKPHIAEIVTKFVSKRPIKKRDRN